ncbi:MAG: [FeFe] hydrogenase, group A [Lachnospiraceae bacterium]|nr:[FeFe] hydrogenase, group A [Lachnospiraceae bacterium]MCH4028293.1 [FeFe] hydrogenase, group A [Lachnospiraceae bacterium]MCH4066139.1 [FeFe] hydrogenase, group A [Lachnospiraceae bacterium]MCH4112173.1 [FeFe] hydrogenase, group A [Lachnospiraceae bacterium]MCI1451156.1 [FeFe] hydrogenase, group A [Prevotella sp.]
MGKHLSESIRVPIEADNPAIRRIENLCIKCGQCRDICRDYISVLGYYDLSKTNDTAVCIHCGQCANVCPVSSITETPEMDAVIAAAKDPDKVLIVSTSPSVRVSLGEAFGMQRGSFVEGKMIALLRKLGADYVLDTNFAADMTIVEEASELVERLTTHNKPLPQFTSCCPAWVKFAEIYYPELLPNISSAKSPIGMQGPTIKTYFAKKMGIDPKKIVNVALTPCTAKKFEIRRGEMNASARYLDLPGLRDMDHVITTRELADWAKKADIDFSSLEDSKFDKLMGEASGAGVIFGNTGGVMEAAVRTAYEFVTHEPAPKELYTLEPVRGMQEIREAVVEIGTLRLQLAVIYGTSNVRRFLSMAKESGKHYDFIEVMTCPGGCIGGGGQPKADVEERRTMVDSRIESLYKRDAQMKLRKSHENPELKQLYEEFYRKPLSPIAEEMLHTSYTDRSGLLGEDAGKYKTLLTFEVDGAEAKNGAAAFFGEETGKNARSERTGDYEEVTTLGSATRKWKCRVCGYIYEGDNPPAECPICHMDSSYFDPVKKWKCRICGYICEDVNPPAECPICHKDSSYFDEIE